MKFPGGDTHLSECTLGGTAICISFAEGGQNFQLLSYFNLHRPPLKINNERSLMEGGGPKNMGGPQILLTQQMGGPKFYTTS